MHLFTCSVILKWVTVCFKFSSLGTMEPRSIILFTVNEKKRKNKIRYAKLPLTISVYEIVDKIVNFLIFCYADQFFKYSGNIINRYECFECPYFHRTSCICWSNPSGLTRNMPSTNQCSLLKRHSMSEKQLVSNQ